MKLKDIIIMFATVNGHSTDDEIRPFSSDPETIEYYQEQMTNLEMSQEDIDNFSNWLATLSNYTTPIIEIVSEYEQQDCVEFIQEVLTLLTPEQLELVQAIVNRY